VALAAASTAVLAALAVTKRRVGRAIASQVLAAAAVACAVLAVGLVMVPGGRRSPEAG
jgi:hypothetical protein